MEHSRQTRCPASSCVHPTFRTRSPRPWTRSLTTSARMPVPCGHTIRPAYPTRVWSPRGQPPPPAASTSKTARFNTSSARPSDESIIGATGPPECGPSFLCDEISSPGPFHYTSDGSDLHRIFGARIARRLCAVVGRTVVRQGRRSIVRTYFSRAPKNRRWAIPALSASASFRAFVPLRTCLLFPVASPLCSNRSVTRNRGIVPVSSASTCLRGGSSVALHVCRTWFAASPTGI